MRRVVFGRAGFAAVAFVATVLVASGMALGVKGELSFQERIPEFDLNRATSLTTSPDGKSLYATASAGDSLTALSIDPGGDDFTYVETETEGIDDPTDGGAAVDGLDTAYDSVVSPDGKNVYAVGGGDNGVAVFDRDAATGELSFVAKATATVLASGLNEARGVAISPDGAYVYAISRANDAVVAFERDAADGTLTQVEAEIDGEEDPDAADPAGDVDGLDRPTAITVAPDGEAVYVGTDLDDSLVTFSRSAATGRLSYVGFHQDGVGGVDGLRDVEDVLVSADDGNVYANGGIFENGVAVFDRDTTTEALSFVEVEKNGVNDPDPPDVPVGNLDWPRQMALSPDDNNLYIAAESSSAIVNFRRGAAGKLAFVGSVSDADSGGTAEGLSGASVVAVGTDGAHVYAGGGEESGLATFERGPSGSGGVLTFLTAKPELKVSGPPGVAVSPDGKHLMLLAEDGTRLLYSFERNTADGSVSLRDTEIDTVDDPSDPGGAVSGLYESSSVSFSPDGRFVYVTAYSEYSIAVFALDDGTGELTYVETEADDVDDPTDSGGEVNGLYEPFDVVIAPDGQSAYAPGNSDNAVAAFSRNVADGKLNFAEAELDGVNDPGDAGGTVEGLDGADSVAISPDGKFLYAGSTGDRAIAAFSRDAATSKLSYVDVVQGTGAGGTVAELERVEDIEISADGRQLYAVGDEKLLRFTRNLTTGVLTLAEVEEDGVDDPGDPGAAADGLDSVETLRLSVDGEEIYVAADSSPAALATFSRTPATGALSFLEVETEGVDDPGDTGPVPTGMGGIRALAISPDDRFLYAAAEEDNSLTVFSREDDFDPPQTTITGGPADGSTTPDDTPSFTYSSSEAGSSFACSVDGAAFGACPAGSLPALGDGAHSFAVAATDAAGNTDPTPAARSFTVETPDTELIGAKIQAKGKQKQKGDKVKVELKLAVGETATGVGRGKIKVGKKSYKLKKLTKDLTAGKTKKLKLKPKKSKDKKKIAKQLKQGKKVKAKLTGKITDEAGNELVEKLSVRLKAK